jgi:predicted transcriptional regulator
VTARATTTLRVDVVLYRRVQAACMARQQTIGSFTEQALQARLDWLEAQDPKLTEAIDAVLRAQASQRGLP